MSPVVKIADKKFNDLTMREYCAIHLLAGVMTRVGIPDQIVLESIVTAVDELFKCLEKE